MVWFIMTKTKKKQLILTINRKGGDITVRHEKRRGWCVFFCRTISKTTLSSRGYGFFKPEILRMLYAMWLNSCWRFKMTP